MSDFDPYEIMLNTVEEADTKRLRIVRWLINEAALDALVKHPISRSFHPKVSELDREFLGIPMRYTGDDGDDPKLTAEYEKYGNKLLIHDYQGRIMHGNEMERWLAAGKVALKLVKAEREGQA